MIERMRMAFSGGQSIRRHPLFPAIVALWFGALFGIGSLAIGSRVLPGLEMELGFGARVALALVMAALGGFVGAKLATRLTRPAQLTRQRKWGAAPDEAEHQPRRSVDVLDDYEEELTRTPRRRALASEGDGAPRYQEEFAPVPGGAPQILDLAQVDCDALFDETPPPSSVDSGAQADWDHAPAPVAAEATTPRVPDYMRPSPYGGQPKASRRFVAPIEPEPEAWDEDDEAAEKIDGVSRSEEIAVTPEPDDSLADVSGIASPQAAERVDTPGAAADGPAHAAKPAPTVFVATNGNSAERIAGADLDALSGVELIERLALSLQRRRAAQASRADNAAPAHEDAPVAAVQHESVQAADPEPADSEPAAEATPEAPMAALSLADIEAPQIEASYADDSVIAQWPVKLTIPRAFRPIGFAEPSETESNASGSSARGSGDRNLGDGGSGESAEITEIASPRRFEMSSRLSEMTPPPAAATIKPLADDDHDEGPIVAHQRRFGRQDFAPLVAVTPAEAPAAAAIETRFDLARQALPETPAESPVQKPVELDGNSGPRFAAPLDLKATQPVRRPFIRIEDFEDEDGDEHVEEMVVFPRKDVFSKPQNRFDAVTPAAESPAPPVFDRIAGVISSAADTAPMRAFDREPAAEPPPPAPTAEAAPGRGADMAETERALRSALASLQRISGAA